LFCFWVGGTVFDFMTHSLLHDDKTNDNVTKYYNNNDTIQLEQKQATIQRHELEDPSWLSAYQCNASTTNIGTKTS